MHAAALELGATRMVEGAREEGLGDELRANTYALLGAMLARPPTRELLDLLGEIEAPRDNGLTLSPAWEVLRLAGERARVDAVEDEYQDLFIGLGRGELVPYGSWYLTGFMMDRPLALLRADLTALGVERRAGVHEPEDHAAALCETMSFIVSSPEEISLDTQRAFFANHLASWMGTFFTDLQAAKSARFYRAVGQFGEQFIAFEKQYLNMLA